MTTRLRRPVLSPTKQIPIQSLLRMTTCLKRDQRELKREEKTCLKQPLQIVNRCEIEIEIKHKATTIKSEHLSHYIYSAI